MEKVRPLGRLGFQLRRGGFHYGADPANFSPGYRNPQPAIRRSPPSRSDKKIFFALPQQLGIQATDLARDIRRSAGIEFIRFYIDDVGDIGFFGVAQSVVGVAKRAGHVRLADFNLPEFCPGGHRPEL